MRGMVVGEGGRSSGVLLYFRISEFRRKLAVLPSVNYVICRRSACNLLNVKCRVDQAKESWEMDEDEKLEQAEIMKGNGTKFFKVSHTV